jgi:hypothetical protein
LYTYTRGIFAHLSAAYAREDRLKKEFYLRFEVFTAVIFKNTVFWDFTPCGSCKNRRFEELSASFIRMTRIGKIGTTLAVTSNRRTLRRNTK